MAIKGLKIGGLKTTPLTPVPGVISPEQTNNATPSKVGSQAVVKQAKPKKPGQATDKPSVFYKSEDFKDIKKPSIEKLRAFLERQRSKNKDSAILKIQRSTMSQKKFTPREAALAVLKKASELFEQSSLSKSEDLKKGDWAKIHSKLKREGYSEESADKIDGAIKAKMGKSMKKMDDMDGMNDMEMSENNPDAKADAKLGEEVEKDVAQHEASNKDPEHHEKGSYKLAKFMGKMEMKKGPKSAEMDKSMGGMASMPAMSKPKLPS